MDYDFSGLNTAQQWLLTMQGWDPISRTGPKPQKRTVEPLIARGLLVALDGVIQPNYMVPRAVHIAWCQYCDGRIKRYVRA